ncbi:MAG: penicillin-binding protein 1C, partial [Burkholderiales bacterium]|nr:penicillin-binding protein 1C [Burkholderiales bacterium]
PMWDVSGITGAAPVWQEVMQYLYKRDSGHVEPIATVPVKIERRKISYEGQLEAARNELFLPGTAQTYLALAKSDNIQPAILYPKSGMIVALDPDIPPERQRIRFDANAKGNGMLVLDGHLINHPHGSKSPALKELVHDWSPWPGKHVLSLLDAGGKLLDQVHFEVRGAYVAADLRKAAMNTDLRKPLQQR